MSNNIKKFGKLQDNGCTGDGKRTFVNNDFGSGEWQEIRIDIDTDDCDRKHALEFKFALIELWNNQ